MKMKKIVCIMVLACLVFSVAFAQKSSFGVDLFQLVKGFIASDNDNDYSVIIISGGYEMLVAPHFSLGVDAAAYFISYKVGVGANRDGKDGLYLSVAADGRYYPMSENFEKFFIGTTVGFNSLSLDGSTKPADGGFQGLVASMKVGYKLITEKKLYLEPSMSYVLSKIGSGLIGSSVPTPRGWNAGLRLGLVF
jgi:hypothetical protein